MKVVNLQTLAYCIILALNLVLKYTLAFIALHALLLLLLCMPSRLYKWIYLRFRVLLVLQHVQTLFDHVWRILISNVL